MARGSCLAGKIKAGILGLALLGGMALPANADGPAEARAIGVCLAHHGLHVPQHFQTPIRTPPRRSNSMRRTACSMATCGDPIPHYGENIELDYGLGITPKWGPVTFNFAGLYYTYPGERARSTISRRWAVRPGPAARGPLASRTIGRRITSSFLASLMRSRAPSATPGPSKLWNFFTPSISGGCRLPVVRGKCRRLRVLECRPDP